MTRRFHLFALGTVALFLILLAWSPAVVNAATSRMGGQLSEGGCCDGPGPEVYTPPGGGETAWFGDYNQYDPNGARVYLDGNVAWDRDFRIGIQVSDGPNHGSGCGSQIGPWRYTGWASEGGGRSGWASDYGSYDPNCIKLVLETRAFPTGINNIYDARVGIEVSDTSCKNQFSGNFFTPWARSGGGWSGWANDPTDEDFDCLQLTLEVVRVERGNIRVLTKKVSGPSGASAPLSYWQIKDSQGTVVIQETAGSRDKTYTERYPGIYTIQGVPQTLTQNGYKYILQSITPSQTQTLGTLVCAGGQDRPHNTCQSQSCVIIDSCGPSECYDCDGSTPPRDKDWPPLLWFPDWLRGAPTAHAIALDDPGTGSHKECTAYPGTCASYPGDGIDECATNADCGSYTPPPQPPAPSPPSITFTLNYVVEVAAPCTFTCSLGVSPASGPPGSSFVFNVATANVASCSGSGTNRRYSIDYTDNGSYDATTPWTGCYNSQCKYASWTASPYASAGNYTARGRVEWANNVNGTVVQTCTAAVSVANSATTTQNTLTVTKAGAGSGTVTSSPVGIDCGADCSQAYASGTIVALRAAPDPTSAFNGWSGSCSGSGNPISINMNGDKTCTANFSLATTTPGCTITVNSNTPTNWQIGGPQTDGQWILSPGYPALVPSATHMTDSSGNILPTTGVYNILVPQTLAGYENPQITPADSQSCADGTADFTVTYAPVPPLTVTLTASPDSGQPPLLATLSADIETTAVGPIDYRFWWDCDYSGVNAAAAQARCGNVPDLAGTATGTCQSNANGYTCNDVLDDPQATVHTYDLSGAYRAFVIATRGSSAGWGSDAVTVGAIAASHKECQNRACVSVGGAGPDRCDASADCGDPGSFRGVCDAVQQACVNVAGGGVSTCGSDPVCSGATASHLECQNNACVIVGGAGSNSCSVIGGACASGPADCTFTATPSLISRGGSSLLEWTCTGVALCDVTNENNGVTVANDRPAIDDVSVSPASTTPYQLDCDNGAFVTSTTVRVRTIVECNPGDPNCNP